MKKRLFPLTASGGGGGGSQAVLIEKEITENGEYRAESEQADGFSMVTVAVPEPVLTTKSITTNGTYTASSDSADGFSSVTVNAAYDPIYGARPLKRYIQRTVETMSAKLILSGNVQAGDTILLDVQNGEMVAVKG